MLLRNHQEISRLAGAVRVAGARHMWIAKLLLCLSDPPAIGHDLHGPLGSIAISSWSHPTYQLSLLASKGRAHVTLISKLGASDSFSLPPLLPLQAPVVRKTRGLLV